MGKPADAAASVSPELRELVISVIVAAIVKDIRAEQQVERSKQPQEAA